MNAPAQPRSYLSAETTLRSWLFTTDHKRIGILYLVTITAFFAIGGIAATIFRLELLTPVADLVSADVYNRLFTVHGVVMVWFFLIPSIPTVLGNFLLPLMIGASDVAFPRLNLASWYVFALGGIFTIATILLGGVDTGWTFYTPYSSVYSRSEVLMAAAGVFIVGFSSVMTGLNMMVTVHTLRAPGLDWWKLPLFVWSLYATSLIMVLATPVLSTALLLISLERLFGVGFFDPSLGGDPILFQHLFWFYSHPAVYIMILPGMGVTSETIATFSRNPVFGYKAVAMSSMAIALIGFLVWGHHMFVSGQSPFASTVFSLLSWVVAVPSAIKVFNWTATLHKGRIHLRAPLLYALCFIALFTVGGMTGLYLAAMSVDVHVHDTYFVVAHFHFIMVGGMVTAYLGGLHYWWPKISGRMYPERAARIAVLAIILGFLVTFGPQFLMGYQGMPRRYQTYPEEFQALHALSTFGAILLTVGYGLPILYLLWSLKYGARAGDNPWNSYGLEWKTSSPPPKHNFTCQPRVEHPPYTFPPDDAEEDADARK